MFRTLQKAIIQQIKHQNDVKLHGLLNLQEKVMMTCPLTLAKHAKRRKLITQFLALTLNCICAYKLHRRVTISNIA